VVVFIVVVDVYVGLRTPFSFLYTLCVCMCVRAFVCVCVCVFVCVLNTCFLRPILFPPTTYYTIVGLFPIFFFCICIQNVNSLWCIYAVEDMISHNSMPRLHMLTEIGDDVLLMAPCGFGNQRLFLLAPADL
jgi:hypothetical protein